MDIIAFLPHPETDLAMGTGDPFWTPLISMVGVIIIMIIFAWIRAKRNKKILNSGGFIKGTIDKK